MKCWEGMSQFIFNNTPTLTFFSISWSHYCINDTGSMPAPFQSSSGLNHCPFTDLQVTLKPPIDLGLSPNNFTLFLKQKVSIN